MNFRPRGNDGSAMLVVLTFAAVGLIVVTSYLAHQARANVKALRSPAVTQATLNARSGVYRVFETLFSKNALDTLETIHAIDRLFGADMFNDADTGGFYYEAADTGAAKKTFLYARDSVNTAFVAVQTQGIYGLITSTSTAFNITRAAEARLGCQAPAKPDTVLILENDLPINGRFKGKAHRIVKTTDSLLSVSSSRNQEDRINGFISGIKRQNTFVEDTSVFGNPLIIRTHKEFAVIPDTVKTHLLLDGAALSAAWKSRRKITVYGDLQITGFFTLENVEFKVGGDIKLLDNASLANVGIFSMRRIFIGDNAVFQGDALAMVSVNVYGKAAVRGRSTLIAAGVLGSTQKPTAASNRYSIFISDASEFDGTAVALGAAGGIKTDPGAKLSGVLWAQKNVCHNGILTGIIKAEYLSDCSNQNNNGVAAVQKITENAFGGAIEPLASVDDYKMPYFIGTPLIINWREF